MSEQMTEEQAKEIVEQALAEGATPRVIAEVAGEITIVEDRDAALAAAARFHEGWGQQLEGRELTEIATEVSLLLSELAEEGVPIDKMLTLVADYSAAEVLERCAMEEPPAGSSDLALAVALGFMVEEHRDALDADEVGELYTHLAQLDGPALRVLLPLVEKMAAGECLGHLGACPTCAAKEIREGTA
jgi:hypothetical protein